jgi:predicted DnaQ family exonuclease/DinG family helicase
VPKEIKFPDTIVGLDLETTSLEPDKGGIIEVAAIRYDLSKSNKSTNYIGCEIDEFTRLIKPDYPITDQVTAITGITTDMVEGKPAFSSILPELKYYIGDSTVFAHNASFDISFLAFHGLDLIVNPIWDTFSLSSIAWPEATSYNLGMLSDQLSIKVEGEHRAGDDVRLTWELLNKIYLVTSKSTQYYESISELLKKSEQNHYLCFFSSLKKENNSSNNKHAQKQKPNNQQPVSKDDLSIEKILGKKGILGKKISKFHHRPEQIEMARAVEKNIKDKAIGLVEAGTGTGKTFAYLVPLLTAAIKHKPCLVSTFTRNLQDQLFEKDVPALLKALDLPMRTAILKGRRNYLCHIRLLQALQRTKYSSHEAFLLIKLLTWLNSGGNGDLDKLNISYQANHILRHLHADAMSCRLNCEKKDTNCPYHKARRLAEQADIVIVNHALLVQLSSDDSSLSLSHVVIDEAHHLAQVARESTRIDFSYHRIEELIAPIIQLSKKISAIQQRHIIDETKALLADYLSLLQQLTEFITVHSSSDRLRLTESIYNTASWKKIKSNGSHWRNRLQFLTGLLSGIKKLSNRNKEILHEAVREADRFNLEMEMFFSGNSSRIQWLEMPFAVNKEQAQVTLNDLSLSVDSTVNQLFINSASVTLTSATLTTGGNFSYIKEQLGIPEANEKHISTPFNFRKQMLIYIIEDGPPPATPDFDIFSAKVIEQVAILLSGRLLGLFTSHKSVRNVYEGITKKLYKANIKTMAQKITGGRHNITTRFKKIESSVLLGTNSFWEGIDVPGDCLSSVVIPKFPFPPPNDPIIEALAEQNDLESFNRLSMPIMILKLRQGIGRLLRSTSDKGVIIILDARFLKKSYGDEVLKSLPPATIKIGSVSDLNRKITDWFGVDILDNWRQKLEGDKEKNH